MQLRQHGRLRPRRGERLEKQRKEEKELNEAAKEKELFGSYFAHPELLLTTMLASDEEEERRFAVKVIREGIRKGTELGSYQPRQFRAPPVNFQAENLQHTSVSIHRDC